MDNVHDGLQRATLAAMENSSAAVGDLPAGAFSRADALGVGYSADAIKHRLATEEWVPMWRGTYVRRAALEAAEPGSLELLRLRAQAACLSRAHTVASHDSAARLWLIELLGLWPDAVSVTCVRRLPTTARLPDGVVVNAAGLPTSHVSQVDGIPATTPARTVVDLGRRLPLRAAVVAADSALRRGLVTPPELSKVAADCARWPGIRRARQVVAFADGRSESVLESVGRVLFYEHGLPAPELQVVLGDEHDPIGRADYYWPDYRTVGEADGLGKYTDPAVLVAEKLRQERLREAGFEVVRFTWHQAFAEPERTAHRIRCAFARGLAARSAS